METLTLLGTVLGIGLVSGINLYATVLALGLAFRFNLIALSPSLEGLDVLSEPVILWTAGILYTVEFFADKIPWVDSLWDVIHTFVRPLGAAVLAGVAVGTLDPVAEIALILLCGGVALSSHSSKAGTRILVNHSPEPFSNWALSLLEDMIAIGGVWLALAFPIVALVLVIVFVIAFIWFFPKLVRVVRASSTRLFSLITRPFKSRNPIQDTDTT